jgi:hypothetical protein
MQDEMCWTQTRVESAMYCCPNCFAHNWLKRNVEEHSDITGTCDFCESEDVPLLSTDELAHPFHNLLSMYVLADTYERRTCSCFTPSAGEFTENQTFQEVRSQMVRNDGDIATCRYRLQRFAVEHTII